MDEYGRHGVGYIDLYKDIVFVLGTARLCISALSGHY